jgi:hypothetical protein
LRLERIAEARDEERDGSCSFDGGGRHGVRRVRRDVVVVGDGDGVPAYCENLEVGRAVSYSC